MADRPSEPPNTLSAPEDLLAAYLDWYRATLLVKLAGLSDVELRTSRMPSGWTPLGLLTHLTHVERRWLRWGFRGEQVPDPWADDDGTGGWLLRDTDTLASLTAAFEQECALSREVVARSALGDRAATGGRFSDDPPTLSWILFHVLQEYARHLGHLDVARELADGVTGE